MQIQNTRLNLKYTIAALFLFCSPGWGNLRASPVQTDIGLHRPLPALEVTPGFMLAGNGRAPGDETALTQVSLRSGGRAAADLILEARRARSGGTDEKRRATDYVSGHLYARAASLFWGRRFFPGPATSFLSAPGLWSGVGSIPSGRTQGLAGFELWPGSGLPGLFGVEGSRGVGGFVHYSPQTGAHGPRKNSILAAYHHGARTGALALDLHETSARTSRSLRADLTWAHRATQSGDERGMLQGFASGHIMADQLFSLGVQLERRNSWDLFHATQPGQSRTTVLERWGRSGLIGMRLGLGTGAGTAHGPSLPESNKPELTRRVLDLEAAGQDRGADLMRAAGVSVFVPDNFCAPAVTLNKLCRGLFVRARSYRHRSLHKSRPALVAPEATGAALGFGFEARKTFAVRFTLEGRQHTVPVGELLMRMRAPGGITLGLSMIYRRAGRPDMLLLLYGQRPGSADAEFLLSENAALRLQLQARFMYIAWSASTTGGRTNHYAQMQFAWRFSPGSGFEPQRPPTPRPITFDTSASTGWRETPARTLHKAR